MHSSPKPTTEMSELSDQEVTSFETFGYLHLPGVFAGEIAHIQAEFEELARSADWDVVRCDQFYDASRTGCEQHPRLMSVEPLAWPGLAWLRDHRCLRAIASRLSANGDYDYVGSQASLFNCDTHWHHDGMFTLDAGRHLLVSVAIDALDGDTGALRVIPGSHLPGPFRTALRTSLMGASSPTSEAFGLEPDQLPAQVLAVEPGDVVVLDYDIVHASFGGGVRRRALTVGFGPAGMSRRLEQLRESSQ